MGDPVMSFEIAGKDPEALRRFYGGAFGWRMGSVRSSYAMAYPDAGRGIDGVISPAPGGAGHAFFYIEVVDLEAALRNIEGLGGKRMMGPIDVPTGPSIALFADPEGNVIGLVKARSGDGR